MNRLGDAATDVLFRLIALNNDPVAPAAIPTAVRAQVRETSRALAELLVTEGGLTPAQRDLVETQFGDSISRDGREALKGPATLISTPSAGDPPAGLGDPGVTENVTPVPSLGATVPHEFDPRLDDPDRTIHPPADVKAGARPRITGYEIREMLGEGGMGVVYKARQERLDRFVALKMIRSGARPQDLVRFETEAKAVAAIEHANIVKIFDIAEQDGVPYLSLEFVAGGSLAMKIGGKPQPVAEAARIVEVLARAIAVAHQHGVVHRDLKPANVLLAADGTPKITDFGLVKRLEGDSGQTRTGAIVGTPSYMAPEQARGEGQNVGLAADQYSLGAILYEMLTGRPPFQGASVLDTLEMVRSREPVAPSQLQPKTPPDLETICLKCLEKDVARRYSDVLALAEDLRRFQAGEPILARPVSDTERLWRWCLRNRRLAIMSAAVALLLVIVAAGSAIAAVTLGRAYTATEEKRKLAVAAARAANEQNKSLVDAQVELVHLLDGKLRDVAAIENEREELIDKAIARLRAAVQAMTNLRRDVQWAPEDEGNNWLSLARAHQAQARVSLLRNKVEDAMAEFLQIEEIIARLLKADPGDRRLQVNWLRIEREIGHTYTYRLGEPEKGQAYIHKALDKSQALLQKNPDDDVYKGELANSLGLLAGWELKLGRLKEANKLYQDEIEVRKSFSPVLASDSESRRELAGLYAQLAALDVRMGDREQGQRRYKQSLELREQFAGEQPEFWPAQNDLGLSYNQLGAMLYPQGGDAAGARKLHQKALPIFKARATADPSDFENKHILAETLYYEATCALHLGKKDEAAGGYRECLKVCKELASEPKAKQSQTLLMLALARCGDHAGAAKIAATLVAASPRDAGLYIQAACGYALAAGAPGVGAKAKQAYTRLALECLRGAKGHGWADVVTLETDTDLEPIRNEKEFKALLDELRQHAENRP
jgi:tetratricopeptide (TPR) repeat protein/tRNA A-37 threonylcarbamoyl transferase component Bud32